MSDSLRPYGLLPARLLCPWDSPGNYYVPGTKSHNSQEVGIIIISTLQMQKLRQRGDLPEVTQKINELDFSLALTQDQPQPPPCSKMPRCSGVLCL